MTLEQILEKRVKELKARADNEENSLTSMYWNGRADGISEVLDLMENNTNE